MSRFCELGKPVGVSCYSGYRYAERPLAFIHLDRRYQVIELERSWFEESGEGSQRNRKACFQVRADDGNLYVLSRCEQDDNWTLERALFLS